MVSEKQLPKRIELDMLTLFWAKCKLQQHHKYPRSQTGPFCAVSQALMPTASVDSIPGISLFHILLRTMETLLSMQSEATSAINLKHGSSATSPEGFSCRSL
jgi:hypothetical protein